MILHIVEAGAGRDDLEVRGIFDTSEQAIALFTEIKEATEEDAFVTQYELNKDYSHESTRCVVTHRYSRYHPEWDEEIPDGGEG